MGGFYFILGKLLIGATSALTQSPKISQRNKTRSAFSKHRGRLQADRPAQGASLAATKATKPLPANQAFSKGLTQVGAFWHPACITSALQAHQRCLLTLQETR